MGQAEKSVKFQFLVTLEVFDETAQNRAIDGPLLRQNLYDAVFDQMDRPLGCGVVVELLPEKVREHMRGQCWCGRLHN